jgi:thiamine kinase-like enzyme
VRDNRQYSDYTGGPYTDEATFNSSFYFDLVETTPSPIRTALYQQLRSDHRIVFTHGDIAQHNILVKDGQITGLLDWENAGWYPEHWDYIKFFERPCKHMDWKDGAKEIFPQIYDKELAYHQAILRWQRP